MEQHEPLDPTHIGDDFEDLEQGRLDTLCDLLFESSHLAPRDESLREGSDTPWRPTTVRRSGSRLTSGCGGDVVVRQSQTYERPNTAVSLVEVNHAPRTMLVPATQQAKRTTSATALRSRLSACTLLTGLLIAAFCFLRGASAPIEQTRAIEDIRPGYRVLVDAPAEALATDVARLNDLDSSWNASTGNLEIEGVADPLRELNEATAAQLQKADYRLVLLQAKEVWEDGTNNEINVQTLQPWQWLHENEVHVGGEAPLPLETVDMNLPAGMTGKVLDILPCPKLERGAGRTVLTTVNRLARGVIELTLRDQHGKEETLRPTDEHLFYSASQGEWLSAGELQPGERLDGVDGVITVAAVTPLAGTHRVFNMTVQGEHLYRVAECGVLVHNNCSKLTFEHASGVWKSTGGLIFGPDRRFGNRVMHVLRHIEDDVARRASGAAHSIFDIPRTKLVALLDEVWIKKGASVPGDPGAFIVDLGRRIGRAGETHVKLIVKPGTAEVLSAYPIIP